MRQVVRRMLQSLTPDDWQVLLSNRLFTGISEPWLRRELSDPRCRKQSYYKDAFIFAGRQFERSLGILLSGEVSVLRTNHDGRKMLISTQIPGAIFGVAVLFSDAEEFATEMLCKTACQVLMIQESLLREMMQQEFQVTENYIRYLSSRISFLNSKITGLSAGDSIHKLACWLLEHGQDGAVPLRSMSALASQLNIGRASLYRAVEALESAGIIQRSGKHILLLAPAQLHDLHEQDTRSIERKDLP